MAPSDEEAYDAILHRTVLVPLDPDEMAGITQALEECGLGPPSSFEEVAEAARQELVRRGRLPG